MTKRKSPQAKGWETRRKAARARAAAARKGWETRRANAAMLAEFERLAGLTRARTPSKPAPKRSAAAGRPWTIVYDAPIVAGEPDEDAAFGVAKAFHDDVFKLGVNPAVTRERLKPFAGMKCTVQMQFAFFANESGRVLERLSSQRTLVFGPDPYDDLFGVAGLFATAASQVLRNWYGKPHEPMNPDGDDDERKLVIPGTNAVTFLLRRIRVRPA